MHEHILPATTELRRREYRPSVGAQPPTARGLWRSALSVGRGVLSELRQRARLYLANRALGNDRAKQPTESEPETRADGRPFLSVVAVGSNSMDRYPTTGMATACHVAGLWIGH